MKRIYIIGLIFITYTSISAQIDRSKQPDPGPAPTIQLEDPIEFQLKNGLTALLVENHKLPRVSISLSIDHPLLTEGDKKGATTLLTTMMGKGSTSVSKNDFEEAIDFMGAHFHFNDDGAHTSSLSRYYSKVLELLADAALNPNFLEEEFQKEKDKVLKGIETSEKDVKTAARRVENLISYGSKHPYGEYVAKETVENLNLKDIKETYEYIYNPKNAYLIIVGDFDSREVKKQIKKDFGQWEARTQKKRSFSEPENTPETRIAFVEMSNAVQSEIALMNTFSLNKKSSDYFAAVLANQILGGGAEARLFLNLREDKGFTYGAYSQLRDSHKTKGRFRAGTSVRNAVTDSAVVEMISEVAKIRIEPITDEELELVKAKYAGNFVISLEDPETIANFAYNIKTQNLPKDFYKNYLKNINKVTKEEVSMAAKKYILSDQAQIVVTGKGSEILDKLEQIPFNGAPLKVSYFDKYGNQTERPDYSKLTPEGVTVSTVINNYLRAIGGQEKLSQIKSIQENSQGSMQGLTLEIESKKTNQKQLRMDMKMMGNLMQKQVVNKSYAYMEVQGQKIDMEGDQLEEMISSSAIFPELDLDLNKVALIGLTDLDGTAAYEVKFSDQQTHFYDAQTHLKLQTNQTLEVQGNSQTSTIKYSEYKAVEGILFPHKTTFNMGPQEIDFISKNIILNLELEDSLFE